MATCLWRVVLVFNALLEKCKRILFLWEIMVHEHGVGCSNAVLAGHAVQHGFLKVCFRGQYGVLLLKFEVEERKKRD